MAAPGFGDGADVEALIAYISNELIPQRVADLATARPRRILTRPPGGSVGANAGTVLTGWLPDTGDGGDGAAFYGAGAGTIAVAAAGVYEVEFYLRVTGASAASPVLSLQVNGSPLVSSDDVRTAGTTITLSGATRRGLYAGDELNLHIFSGGGGSSFFAGHWTIEKVA